MHNWTPEMGDEKQDRASRVSMCLLGSLRIDNEDAEHVVKIRNLSATGLLAQGHVPIRPGSIVTINIRNIGWVNGIVAWALDDRFGVVLTRVIDPAKARTFI